jgi:hypothetical protein
MATLEEYKTALRMRDILQKLAADVVDEKVGKTEYATVTSVNYFTRKCTVQYASGKTATVNMGSRWPSATGQVVRLAGTRGDRYIDDVMGPVAIPANSYFKSVDDVNLGARSQWDGAGTWGNWIAKVVNDTLTFAYGATEDTAFSINKYGLYVPASSGASIVSYQGTDAGSTTRITYASTLTGSASGMTLNFIGPPSNRAMVILTCWMKASAGVAYMDCVITDTVTSTVRHAAADGTSCQTSNTAGAVITSIFTVAGLVTGNNHSVVLNFRSSVATSTANYATSE